MLERQKSRDSVFFQIHKDGHAVDGRSFGSLPEACVFLEKAAQGGEVTEVDAFDRILRRYTLTECRTIVRHSYKT